MGRSPCCEKVGLKKGPWTPEEDQKLLAYIEEHGHGSWRALPVKAGLQRCGKSCRLRWTNYLRPDIKRGKFSLQEEQTIIQLHALLGNRWSAIATHLPKRTDNEIKNYWNTHLKKRLTKMGIDPVTHKPKTDALGSGSGNPKDAANLSHMAQWESARLEAEARLVRESKILVSNNNSSNNSNPLMSHQGHQLGSASASTSTHRFIPKAAPLPPCLDVLKAWQGTWSTKPINNNMMACMMAMDDLESPTSTLNFNDNCGGGATCNFAVQASVRFGVDTLEDHHHHHDHSNTMSLQDIAAFECTDGMGSGWFVESGFRTGNNIENVTTTTTAAAAAMATTTTVVSGLANIMEGFADIFTYNSVGVGVEDDQPNSSVDGEGEGNNSGGGDGSCAGASGIFEENKSYWNSILNLVNASPAGSPVF